MNPQQYEAVKEIQQPVLVLSGAGTGKTRVITYKMAYLVKEHHIPLNHLLSLTFTNKAALEMKIRTMKLLKLPMRQSFYDQESFISTFHSNCVKILRRHSHYLGYPQEFTILDEADKDRLIKNLMKEYQWKSLEINTSMIKKGISLFKNDFQTSTDILMKGEIDNDLFLIEFSQFYDLYHQTLFHYHMMDFDDLLLTVIRLFYQEPQVLEFWQNQFEYILVDEFQDTNKVQFTLIKLLIKDKGSNLTLVGDDDQCIYSFRGATIGNILHLEKEFWNLKTIRLEQNYRSSPQILKVANAVIQNNKNRLGKTLFTKLKNKMLPIVYKAVNDEDAGDFVLNHVETFQKDIKKKIAIIYRTNAQSRLFETKLTHKNISYILLGGKRFYERMEIKDLVGYLKIIANSSNEIALQRIINTPHRKIGETTFQKVKEYAMRHQISCFEAIQEIDLYFKESKIKEETRKALKNFGQLIYDLQELSQKDPKQILSLVIEQTEFYRYLENETHSYDRISNVEEFLHDYSSFFQEEGLALQDFLTKIDLQDSSDFQAPAQQKWENTQIFLTTVHACKGLEFDIVFIVGLAEELFPHQFSMETVEQLEEERRLFYVAVTRAKTSLFLIYSKEIFLHGHPMRANESRFLKEIPQNLVDIQISPHQMEEKWFHQYL